MIKRTTRSCERWLRFRASPVSILAPKLIRWWAKLLSITAKVINPKPPISTKIMIINCPKNYQCVAVVTVLNPVTQTAEVAVKSASE